MEKYDFLTTVGVAFKTRVNGAGLSAFGSGGVIPLVFYPDTERGLTRLLRVLKNTRIAFRILGAGTNTLIADGGYDGVIISLNRLKQIKTDGDLLTAEAGAALPRLAEYAACAELSGLEFACGIPGTAGGGVYMNAGAYGAELADCISFVDAFDTVSGGTVRLYSGDLGFSYRNSIFQRDKNLVVLRIAASLKGGGGAAIREVMRGYKLRRSATQPTERSLGSVFKRNDGVIPAVLIDKAGLKGYNIGGAKISERHAGFIVNSGGASSSDYRALASAAAEAVRQKFGVGLDLEIEIIK
ncbi:MAG: UDP-N-acetylmuramate dehydrogenase [Clostridiales bacterium]|jgi:UDP-N-acetylmuramate dehydrogenase|nr:UDP-N-acetylmuramate dehydrogenase [Clostridiales bacterium]